MDDLEQIYKEYPGFKFWSIKRRPIVLYFLSYYAIFFAIIKITKISKEGDVFFLFFIFWIAIFAFVILTYSAKGMANYLHKYDEELRLFLFDDKIYVEKAFPLIGTPGLIRFLFRTKDYQLDRVLKNLKYNILIFYICTVVVFVAGTILMQIYP
jgi:hypothetical protein